MDETRRDETTRRAQEGGRRAQEHVWETTKEAARITDQLATAGAETLTVWIGVNQGIVNDLMEWSAKSVDETTRVVAAYQQTSLAALREFQSAVLRWQTLWPEAFRDPIRWYQRALEESVNGTQRTLELSRRSAESLTNSFDRMQTSAAETARSLGETFSTAASRMQDVTSRVERLRAA